MFYLCGALKHSGHNYRIILSCSVPHILTQLESFKPDLVGFSMYSGYHAQCLKIIRELRSEMNIPVIVGGPHPTFFPDIIKEDGVDIVCRGEGELPLVELMDRIDKEQDFVDVANLTVKTRKGQLIANDIRDLVNPLDLLPTPDFGVYREYPIIMNQLQPTIVAVRGCPYSCTYCYNDGYRALYKGKGPYVRVSSPKRVIDDIKENLRFIPHARVIDFPGDCFGIDDSWLEDLMTRYQEEIALPFSCLYRPELITERKAALLAKGGCYYVAFGIESGSERIRKEILKRNYSNEMIIRAADILQRHGIKFRVYNMVGLPTENIDNLWETIKLNVKIKPEMPWCSIYTPYPGTKLSEISAELGLLSAGYNFERLPTNFHLNSILNIPQKDYMLKVHHFFQSMVLFPRLMPLWKILMKIPGRRLSELWFKMIFLYCRIKSDRPKNLSKYIYSMIRSRD